MGHKRDNIWRNHSCWKISKRPHSWPCQVSQFLYKIKYKRTCKHSSRCDRFCSWPSRSAGLLASHTYTQNKHKEMIVTRGIEYLSIRRQLIRSFDQWEARTRRNGPIGGLKSRKITLNTHWKFYGVQHIKYTTIIHLPNPYLWIQPDENKTKEYRGWMDHSLM